MSATFTQITIKEIDDFLKRAFRVMRPRPAPNAWGGELTRDLSLSDKVSIRILTSVHEGTEQAAGRGSDAIRVQSWSKRRNGPLKGGKMPIVKRTQNWRDSLRARVEDLMEEYDDQTAMWESRA